MRKFVNCEDCEFWGQSTTNSGYCLQRPPVDGKYELTQARCTNERGQGEDYDQSNPRATPSPGGCYSGELSDLS